MPLFIFACMSDPFVCLSSPTCWPTARWIIQVRWYRFGHSQRLLPTSGKYPAPGQSTLMSPYGFIQVVFRMCLLVLRTMSRRRVLNANSKSAVTLTPKHALDVGRALTTHVNRCFCNARSQPTLNSLTKATHSLAALNCNFR